MPGSVKHGKSEIKEFIYNQPDIRRIVDVGCGSGTYRNLLGNRYHYVGIEIFPKYIEMFKLLDIYDEVLIGDIYDFSTGVIEGGLPDGDLIIFGDVLEHLQKEKALKTLEKSFEKYKHIVVSIPIDGRDGAIHYGNPHEAHISTWTFDEVKKITSWKLAMRIRGIGIFCL